MKAPLFSLVCATLGRSRELDSMMSSLTKQTFSDFELLIVDQNHDERVTEIVEKYRQLITVIHIRSPLRGLSLHRNIGIRAASGRYIAFPDDDCEYSPLTLSIAREVLQRTYKPGLCSIISLESTCDPAEVKTVSPLSIQRISERYIFGGNKFISYTIFCEFDRSVLFDERLGVGSRYQSSEETDYVLRLVSERQGCLYVVRGFRIYHPYKDLDPRRNFIYGRGMGAFLAKRVRDGKRSLWYAMRISISLLAKSILRPNSAHSNINYASGIVLGFHEFVSREPKDDGR